MGAGLCVLMCPCEHVCIFGSVCVHVTLAVPRGTSPHTGRLRPLSSPSSTHGGAVLEDWEGQRRLWTPKVLPGESFGCGRAQAGLTPRGAPR